MAKRRSILHVESGKIYKTMSAAERDFDIKPGTISWEIQKQGGNSCEIAGNHFEALDPDSEDSSSVVSPVNSKSDKVNTDEFKVKPDVSPKVVSTPKSNKKLDGVIRDKDKAVETLTNMGYSCYLDSGVIMFNGVNIQEAKSAVDSIGYDCSWGITDLTSVDLNNVVK